MEEIILMNGATATRTASSITSTAFNNQERVVLVNFRIEEKNETTARILLKECIEKSFTYKTIFLCRTTGKKIIEVRRQNISVPHLLWLWLLNSPIHIETVSDLLDELVAIKEPSDELTIAHSFLKKIKNMHTSYNTEPQTLYAEYQRIIEYLELYLQTPEIRFAEDLTAVKYWDNGKVYIRRSDQIGFTPNHKS